MKRSMLLIVLGLGIASEPALAGNWTLNFDGIDDYVSILSSPLEAGLPPAGFTYEGWVLAEENSITRTLFYNGPVLESDLTIYSGGTMAFFVKFTDSSWEGISSPAPVGAWFHVAAVYDRLQSELRLYINGSLAASGILSGSAPKDYHGVGFGNYMPTIPPQDGTTFQGRIDIFRVSEGVRYASDFIPEIDLAVEPATLALWDFEEGGGLQLGDLTGNGHYGVIHGASWVQESAAAESGTWSRLKALY